MDEFENCSVYEIRCKDPNINEIYIGATKNIKNRIQQHYYNITQKEKKHYPVYTFIRDNGGWKNWTFVVLETITVENRAELSKRESEYVKLKNPKLNKVIPCRTIKEYCHDNREHLRQQNALFNIRHREKINNIKKEKYKTNKQYYLEASRKYTEKNKDKINAKRRRRYNCLCGMNISLGHRPRHIRNGEHKKKMEELFQNETTRVD